MSNTTLLITEFRVKLANGLYVCMLVGVELIKADYGFLILEIVPETCDIYMQKMGFTFTKYYKVENLISERVK